MNAVAPFIAPLFEALKTFNREPTGFMMCVDRDSKADTVALGQTVYSPRASASAPIDATPGTSSPTASNPDVEQVGITIEKQKVVQIAIDGDTYQGLLTSGTWSDIFRQQMLDGVRKLANTVEEYCAQKAVLGASRANTVLSSGDIQSGFTDGDKLPEFAHLAGILDDNACPDTGRNIVLSNAAMTKLRVNSKLLSHTYALGSDEFLRNGYTDPLYGLRLFKSAGYTPHSSEALTTGYVTNGEMAKGTRKITVKTGVGTIKAGDAIYFGTDTDNVYIVQKDLSAPGDIEIAYPGLVASVATGTDVKVIKKFNPIVAFHQSAIRLAMRRLALPPQGDQAGMHSVITDAKTGMVIDMGYYPQYLQGVLQLGIAFGASVMQPENVAAYLDK